MKQYFASIFLILTISILSCAQQKVAGNAPMVSAYSEQEIIDLSKKKWQWMADKQVDTLSALFHPNSMFVHMGGSWGKEQEIEVIKTGRIWYKKS